MWLCLAEMGPSLLLEASLRSPCGQPEELTILPAFRGVITGPDVHVSSSGAILGNSTPDLLMRALGWVLQPQPPGCQEERKWTEQNR